MLEQTWKEAGEATAKELLVERCRTDVEAFAFCFFPHYCEYDANKFHRDRYEAWSSFKRRVRWADASPRGSAKSTLVALIKPIHDLCYHLEKFIVIISATAGQAAGKLKDIRSELLENPGLVDCFGPFFESRKVAETEYVAKCGDHKCKFVGYGSGTEMRGIRFGEARPSKIILDDVEDSEEVENEALRSKLDDWFKQVVSKLGDEKTKIEVIGTILHKQSLLATLLENPAYRSSKYQAIVKWSERQDLWDRWQKIYYEVDNIDREEDAEKFFKENEVEMLRGTEILWPERETYYDLMLELAEIGKRAFMKERQNDPQASEECLFDDFGWYTETEDGFLIEDTGHLVLKKDLLQCYGTMDPSTGQTKPRVGKKGDFTCILTGYTDAKGRLFVHDDFTKRVKPTQFINRIFDQNDIYDYDIFGVETNLYRNLLLPNIQTEKKQREKKRQKEGVAAWGIQVQFKDIEQVENKQKRIHTLEPKVKNRFILFNRRLSQEFRHQMTSFPLGEHDDCPDALEMLWSMASKRYGLSGVKIKTVRR